MYDSEQLNKILGVHSELNKMLGMHSELNKMLGVHSELNIINASCASDKRFLLIGGFLPIILFIRI